ncbi:hypothetical protein EIP86_008667 [Pleurotus ostreatoroseus]|nr:hypothetical protein EIP86_008667 [Pleurotus ostreatoroseus]
MPAGSKHAGACPVLDDQDYVQAWRTSIENRENVRHLLVFDSSFAHQPPPNYSLKPAEPKPATTPSNNFSIPSIPAIPSALVNTICPEPPVPLPETKTEDTRDIPPLTDFLEDDEDEVMRFRDAHRESNQWLVFLAVFAFINTIFIARLTNTPTRYEAAVLAHANTLLAHAHAARQAAGEALPPFAPHAWPGEEVWVPALWYSSLILNVLNTLVVLLVKNWLMSCSVLMYRPAPEEEREAEQEAVPVPRVRTTVQEEEEDDAHGGSVRRRERTAADVTAERAMLRRRVASLRVRTAAYRRARRDALARTELVRFPSVLLLGAAVLMFSAGALGKAWSLATTGR